MDLLTLPIPAGWLPVLGLAGLAAGWLDSIAGGGGLIALPALLLSGMNPLQALATNKLQGSFGAFTAAFNYTRQGWIDLGWARWLILASFIGAAAGTALVQSVDLSLIDNALPPLLGLTALYFLLSPRISDVDQHPRIGRLGYGLTAAPLIGFYDGFFGPGTGSFFTLSAVALLGARATRAVALTKLLNFASNIASLAVFVAGGQVIWTVGGAMVLGQALGAWLGSNMAIRRGVGLIRPLVVVVCLIMMAKLGYDRYVVGP